MYAFVRFIRSDEHHKMNNSINITGIIANGAVYKQTHVQVSGGGKWYQNISTACLTSKSHLRFRVSPKDTSLGVWALHYLSPIQPIVIDKTHLSAEQ